MIEYVFSHSALGLCAWDIPALLVLIVMVVAFGVHKHKRKKREEKFENQLFGIMMEDIVELER